MNLPCLPRIISRLGVIEPAFPVSLIAGELLSYTVACREVALCGASPADTRVHLLPERHVVVPGDHAAAVVRDRTGAAQNICGKIFRPFGGDRLVRRVLRDELPERVIDEDGSLIADKLSDTLPRPVVLISRGRLARSVLDLC